MSDKSSAATGEQSPDRIFVDNSNLTELKATCDEAVERILTREAAASITDPNLAPFAADHFHTDLRLALGFIAATIMIGTSAWAYFVEKEWKNNKKGCAIAVVVYVVLSAISLIDSYMQGNNIFTGRRKMLSNRIETERLSISSPPLPKAVRQTRTDSTSGKTVLTPPTYTLEINYSRKSNQGQSLLGHKKTSLCLGHLGEWFTEEGEFVESVFQERLLTALQKVYGQ
ncbi:hypothetical protein BCV70DRAFT_202434 [Testicularia cyperi]|uniref:Signal peptidase complex subunit 2 n=1 Tax=Testicularia cyperi TaxID=1882483 RepID=A0A317XKJ0_9BASI|nr:hypothetical protein BCV70DRAFT_202434 [Testicularia cyperi]